MQVMMAASKQSQDGTEFVDSFRAGPDPAQKMSTNLYEIYHCWVYSE